jgi:hypothetical protein
MIFEVMAALLIADVLAVVCAGAGFCLASSVATV